MMYGQHAWLTEYPLSAFENRPGRGPKGSQVYHRRSALFAPGRRRRSVGTHAAAYEASWGGQTCSLAGGREAHLHLPFCGPCARWPHISTITPHLPGMNRARAWRRSTGLLPSGSSGLTLKKPDSKSHRQGAHRSELVLAGASFEVVAIRKAPMADSLTGTDS